MLNHSPSTIPINRRSTNHHSPNPRFTNHRISNHRPQAPLTIFLVLTSSTLHAATTPVTNPSFEVGSTAPAGWKLSGGTGAWEQVGAAGKRSISVTGTGDDQNAWVSTTQPLLPDHLYRLRVMARRKGGADGVATVGPSTNNRDFTGGEIPEGDKWTPLSFVFRTPDTNVGPLRLGQWHSPATLYFDHLSFNDVIPIYARSADLQLGQGEQIQGRTYRAQTEMTGEGSNSARFLRSHTAGFNSNRWLLGTGAAVIYHHQVPGAKQTGATVSVNVNYHISGSCKVDARTTGDWQPLGQLDAVGSKSFTLPASLFPANSVEVRLSGADLAGRPAELQVDNYRYDATLDRDLPSLQGQTHYAEITQDRAPDISVRDWGSLKPGTGAIARIGIGSAPSVIRWTISGAAGAPEARGSIQAPAGQADRVITVPYTVRKAGPAQLELQVERGGQTVFAAQVPFNVSPLEAADYGSLATRDGQVWWTEGAFKIGRDRPAPRPEGTRPPAPLQISAARDEEQALQLVLHSAHSLSNVTVNISSLRGPRGTTLPASAWHVSHVMTVPISQPTDQAGGAGDWPDPLLPYTAPFEATGGQNHPLWLSVTVPANVVAGDYRGTVTIVGSPQPGVGSDSKLPSHLRSKSGGREAKTWVLPLHLHVWDFTLPRGSHLRSAMGISPGDLRAYHNIHTDAELRQVWDLYMQDFAAHRMDPTNPMALDPIRVSIVGEGANRRVELDTTAFDRAAHHYLDEMGFNAFDLPVEGMGGGTFYERKVGEFGGFKAGTPEYDVLWDSYVKQLEAHLRQKGWLSKAYVYWFDEPAAADFPFVREGMERLKKHAPGLVRLLTKEPRPELNGSVDLWCPILNAYDHDRAAEQQRQGAEVWWYICTGPKAPYPGEFIDHPDTDLRVWVWDTWQQNVQGLLIWETAYWQSATAYPNGLQDPWTDPMSWVSGYGTPAGARQAWGNGDGRFLYPPTVAQRAAGKPILTGPVDSVRWEMLREGLQDYEYFWLLRDLIQRAQKRGVPAAEIARCQALLQVPSTVATSLTQYSSDPRPLLNHRAKLAAAIEELTH